MRQSIHENLHCHLNTEPGREREQIQMAGLCLPQFTSPMNQLDHYLCYILLQFPPNGNSFSAHFNFFCKHTMQKNTIMQLEYTETMIKNSRFEKLQNEGQELMQSTQNREMLLLEEFFFLLLIFSSGTIRSYFHRPLVPWKI